MGHEDLRTGHTEPTAADGNFYTFEQSLLDSRDQAVTHPTAIVRSTYSLINQLFYDRPTDTSPIASFLRDYTLPFLDTGKRAIPIKFPTLQPQTRSDRAVIQQLISSGYDQDPQVGLSNLNVIGAIFDEMPDRFTLPIPVLNDGFSRSGLLKPPQSVSDIYDRITEIQRIVGRIMIGQKIRKSRLNLNSSTFRTYAFLKVGSELEIKRGKSQKELDQEAQYYVDSTAMRLLEEEDPAAGRLKGFLDERAKFEKLLGWFDLPDEI